MNKRITAFFVLGAVIVLALFGCGTKKEEVTAEKDVQTEEASDSKHTAEKISDDEALSAIRNYCYDQNPELEKIEKAGEYPVYWEVISSDDNEIVILFRSYTGAEIRYYIDRASGDTYVTEFAPGISSEEERTDESLNVRDYISSDNEES